MPEHLQASLNAADSAACSISTAVVMRRTSWLQFSGFPKEVQDVVQDLYFDGSKLSADSTDKSLCTLKDSRATFRSLGIYISAHKRSLANPRWLRDPVPPNSQPPRDHMNHNTKDRFSRDENPQPLSLRPQTLSPPSTNSDEVIETLSYHPHPYQLH